MHELDTPRLTDSHVHLDDSRFDPDRAAVIDRARQAGVCDLVVPAVDRASWPAIRELANHDPGIHPAYGLHPVFLPRHQPGDVDALRGWLDHNHAVAVGEIGLDFHVPGLDPDTQRRIFHDQLDLARAFRLPVIVHARQATEEASLALRRKPGLSGVIHSYSGSEQQARQLWDAGFLLGIGGPITHERARRLRRIVTGMPLEFLLLESDAPDQPDAGHRGQRNEPARIIEVARCIAGLRGTTVDAIAMASRANARRLFNLP